MCECVRACACERERIDIKRDWERANKSECEELTVRFSINLSHCIGLLPPHTSYLYKAWMRKTKFHLNRNGKRCHRISCDYIDPNEFRASPASLTFLLHTWVVFLCMCVPTKENLNTRIVIQPNNARAESKKGRGRKKAFTSHTHSADSTYTKIKIIPQTLQTIFIVNIRVCATANASVTKIPPHPRIHSHNIPSVEQKSFHLRSSYVSLRVRTPSKSNSMSTRLTNEIGKFCSLHNSISKYLQKCCHGPILTLSQIHFDEYILIRLVFQAINLAYLWGNEIRIEIAASLNSM